MDTDQAAKLIDDLSRKIDFYNDQYYQLGESDIDDGEFDILMDQLVKLEKRYPQLRKSDSPTLRVGGKVTGDFASLRHGVPMLSLSNIYSGSELESWIESLKSRLLKKKNAFVCELKVDGIAISLRYEKGVFKQAVTRGDGEIGEDVSANVKTIRNLPMRLKEELTLELRGEIYLPAPRFKLLNEFRAKQGKPLFKNARNAAAGSTRLKDQKEASRRGLDIFIYDMSEGYFSNDYSGNLRFLKELNFPVNDHRAECDSSEQIMEFCREWEMKKAELPFDIDGVVIKLNDLEDRLGAGATAKSPRWAIAWKFKAERAKSRLISVENSIGRTGVLTPVANLELVRLLGTEVKRATLHNYDQVLRLDIHEHDVLFIEKGGDIIPKITGVDYTQRRKDALPLSAPENCPSCDEKLVASESEIDLRCANSRCPAVIQGGLEHFISKKGMDIQHLGSALIKQLVDKGFIAEIPDIYSLSAKRKPLVELEGMGEKSVDNLLHAAEQSKERPLNHFIFALGVTHIGEKAARTLAERSGSVEKFLNLSEKELEAMPDFGPVMTDTLLEWLRKDENKAMILKLIDLGVSPRPLEINPLRPFAGRRIVITGTLSKPRSEWKSDLEKVGFQVSSSISGKTDYLLIGKSPGSKLKKALKLEVEIISEEDALKLLSD